MFIPLTIKSRAQAVMPKLRSSEEPFMPPNSESPTVSEDASKVFRVSRVSGVRTVTTRADSTLPFVLVS
jgi:hypothetical protein